MSPPAPAALSERDAHHYTGYSVSFLRKARARGEGPDFLKVGRSIRYRIVDLDQWLAAHVVKRGEAD